MAVIMISTDDLSERIYRMLRDIEDGVYQKAYGECAGRLSPEKTAALDAMMKKLLEDCK